MPDSVTPWAIACSSVREIFQATIPSWTSPHPALHGAPHCMEPRGAPLRSTAASHSLSVSDAAVPVRQPSLLILPTPPFPLPLQPRVHIILYTWVFLSLLGAGVQQQGFAGWPGAGNCVHPQEGAAPGMQLERDKRGPAAAGGLWAHSRPPKSRAAPLGCGGSDQPALPPRPERCSALLQVAAPQLHSVGRALWSVLSWGSLGGHSGRAVAGSLAPSRGDPEKGKTSLLGQRRPESGLGSAARIPVFTIRIQGLRSSDLQLLARWAPRPAELSASPACHGFQRGLAACSVARLGPRQPPGQARSRGEVALPPFWTGRSAAPGPKDTHGVNGSVFSECSTGVLCTGKYFSTEEGEDGIYLEG